MECDTLSEHYRVTIINDIKTALQNAYKTSVNVQRDSKIDSVIRMNSPINVHTERQNKQISNTAQLRTLNSPGSSLQAKYNAIKSSRNE